VPIIDFFMVTSPKARVFMKTISPARGLARTKFQGLLPFK
jgi:hypothetical protein